ncbi:hypothetical protein SAMN04487965_2993 [Microbulbifer donghaiensis]|uniref:Uncharacterized protein n=1 Tax=Microbulbifer donghaiensis TaxID=494016 RepID=A0A1M5FP84_9GAMM|nr:hypothetical protein [Microbulbifer donghaiensis]SHF93318.1 hypothetical protein SAMN04487965_2993 [Microbulbifer donghaiensis]
MRYEYKSEASAIITFDAKGTSGLAENVELKFSTVHIRLYKSEDKPGFFSGALAVAAHKDDEGYVLELSLNDSLRSRNWEHEEIPSFDYDFDTGEPSGFYYETQLNDHDFNSITNAVRCHFSEKIEDGRHLLFFDVKIDGTSFRGHALIDEELYHIKSKEISGR